MAMIRKLIILVGFVAILGMLIYPPWIHESRISSKHNAMLSNAYGYFLLTDVVQGEKRPELVDFRIDLTRLLLQCAVVIVVAGGLLRIIRK